MKHMILTEVSNFDLYPDGRLRAGPFLQDMGRIQRLMSWSGLKFRTQNSPGYCSKTALGVMISCAGPDVFGYVLGDDDLEAPSSDLETFLEDIVLPGHSFTIEGHHCPDADTMVRSTLSAWRLNGELMVAAQRVLEQRGADRKVLLNQAPRSVSRALSGSAPALCLVG